MGWPGRTAFCGDPGPGVGLGVSSVVFENGGIVDASAKRYGRSLLMKLTTRRLSCFRKSPLGMAVQLLSLATSG